MTEEYYNWSPDDMLEVTLKERDDFLKIIETLTRIGIASVKEHNELYQSCHIFHKRGRYYIVHFKEMFLLDGKNSTLEVSDIKRRNAIASLLSDWGLLEVVNPGELKFDDIKNIKIIPHKEKCNWKLIPKYTIGNKK